MTLISLYTAAGLVILAYIAFRLYKIIHLKSIALSEHDLKIISDSSSYLNFLSRSTLLGGVFIVFFSVFLYFLKKDFGMLFFYGSLFTVSFVLIDFIISMWALRLIHVFTLSGNEYGFKDVMMSFRIVLAVFVYAVFFILYQKKGINFDYPVVFLGSVFYSIVVYMLFRKEVIKFFYFYSSSTVSFMLISAILWGFKYLIPSDLRYVLITGGIFFILSFLSQAIESFISETYRRFYFSVPFGIVLYFIFPLFVVYLSWRYYINIFTVIPFLIMYFILMFMFSKKEIFDKYFTFYMFFTVILFLFITKVFYIFNPAMNYERYVIFNLINFIPVFYWFFKNNEYNYLISIDKNIEIIEKTDADLISLKKMFFIVSVVSGFGFKIAYDYMNLYFGYSDTYNFFSSIIAVFFFYAFEYHSQGVFSRFESNSLRLVFGLSVIVFIYSASIVMISYIFDLNFINLVSFSYIYAFLTLLFSNKYISCLISLLYISVTYILIYV